MQKAAIYTRISTAALNDTTATDEQERLCRELCDRNGWAVGEVFTDPNRSAWRRDRKRDGWDAMLAAIRDGRYSILVTYWGDRLVRQPRDLEDLLDLRDGRDLTLASVAGRYDFANPDHRMMMRWEVARACNESDTISRRVKAANARRAQQGLTRIGGPGGRAFGWLTDGVTPVPAEQDIIREAAARVLAGQSLRSVCADFTARGITTVTGRPWTHGSLRFTLTIPRQAGLMPDGQTPGAWEPVLAREEWERLRSLLQARGAKYRPPGNARKHLLSGIAECGNCGTRMQVRPESADHLTGYGCQGCHRVQRSMRLLDGFVIAAVVARLGHDQAPAAQVPQAPGLAAEFASMTEALAELDELIADPASGSVRALLARRAAAESRLAELRELAAGDAASRLRALHAGITAEGFRALPLAEQRALVAACYRIVVRRSARRGPGFDPSSVLLEPRD